jgi:class 3 adenylate cyclase/tetratricopeptide (TPR) repeat protein
MDVAAVCGACGASNPADARFCGSCGASLGILCPSCGRRNPADGKFCTECGSSLSGTAPAPALGSRQSFMPAELADKVRAGSAALEGERKLITVLFADVVGYTALSERLDPEEIRGLMHRAFEVMLNAVHRYEGTVAQLQGDGLLALFGAPIAHEDHAVRASLAGLEMQEGLQPLQEELAGRDIDFRVRVGLHSGLVVFGRIGSDLEFTFQAVGDTVNTASRVQGLAEPGTVVMSEATRRLATGYVVLEDRGEFAVKNKAEPVHVYQAIRAAGPRSRVDVSAERGLGPYVGREHELAELRARFEEASQGSGRVVFITGEAGLGKSRLVHEFRERLEDDRLWLLGRCISYGADIPYVPIVDLARSACGVEEADAEDVIIEKLTRRVDELGGDPANLPYLRFLLSVDPGDPSVLDEDPMLRKPRVFEAFRDVLLAAVRDRPAVLVIEDLHWIDPPSVELLSFVADAVPDERLLVLLTHRPEWDSPLGDRPFYRRIVLEPLSASDTALVAGGASGAQTLPPAIAEEIYRKAEGNPFFIEEVTKSLVESGDLLAGDEGLSLGKPIDEIRVPDSVQDVIMARLDRLADEPRRALQTASVIGREFTSRLLERTEGRVLSEGAVRQLKAVQLIFERSLYPELVFMFKHALTHEVAYESLLLERRRALHGAVGDAIKELYADRPTEVVEMLAHHYERAERWDNALEYLAASADKAMAGFALVPARAYADRALAAMARTGRDDPALRAHLHHLRGQCYELRNEWSTAIDCYRQMAAAAEDAGDETTRGYGLALVSLAQIYAHDIADGAETASEAAAIARRTGDVDLAALSEMSLMFGRVVSGQLEESYAKVDHLETVSRGATDAFTRILGIDFVGETLHMQSREAEAAARVEEALAIGEATRLAQPMQYIYFDLALITLAQGRYDVAFDAARKNIALSERVGDQGFWWCRAKNTLGRIYIELGDLDRGALHNQDAIERALVFGDLETLRNAQLNLADCVLGRGDSAGGIALFTELDTTFNGDTDPGEWMKWRYTMHLWMGLSTSWLASGDPDRALGFADRCVERATVTRTTRYVSKGHRARGLALAALNRHDEALVEIDTALAAANEIGGPEPVWQARFAQARVLRMTGRIDDSRIAAVEALRVVDEIVAGLREPGAGDILLASSDVAALRVLAAG